jgi:hypothetical protein
MRQHAAKRGTTRAMDSTASAECACCHSPVGTMLAVAAAARFPGKLRQPNK